MRYATLLLGAVLLLASIVAARAGDHWSYVCPGKIRVDAVSHPDSPEAETLDGYFIGKKKIPQSDLRFETVKDKHGEITPVLYYRGRKCAGPLYD